MSLCLATNSDRHIGAILAASLLALIPWGTRLCAQDTLGALYRFDENLDPRWSTPEGHNGEKGRAGTENNGAKGHPCETINAGATCVMLDSSGPGIISRIWLTIDDRSPEMLRSLKFEIYWDGEKNPAVSVPLGDFFGVGLGRTAQFHNALFAEPEGRSFICFIPMPFKKAVKIQVTNESPKKLTRIFFEVDFQRLKHWDKRNLYFHAFWSRNHATTLGSDFELLPRVTGRGRFLGVNVGVNANPVYEGLWWGEGEVKMFLNGDVNLPTFAGTGTEDYVGTGWGESEFINDYSGCPIADVKKSQWAFYRYNIPDSVYFDTDCRVTLQQIGGGPTAKVSALKQKKIPLIPVGIDVEGRITKLFENGKDFKGAGELPGAGWENFFRSDDVSATAYYYLDSPSVALPALQPVSERVDLAN